MQLRLIDENGRQVGVVSLEEALKMAIAANLDLVEIQPKLVPPVAKIMNYGKFQFSINKRKSLAKKKQKEIKIKEVKFRPNTGNNDYLIKLKNIKNFLLNGNKIKIIVCFKGREIIHKNSGLELMKKICFDLQDFCKVDADPKFEGKNIITIISSLTKIKNP
ncbi:Translation initiation factor IF-3 [Candidatus Azoamicus ciliaticola]|uniref:Translation initiation factor IF-3 n=1 Tax=Candidatus Azoamicus ciliaticola TaxID=2652803 RepID=A0A6J5JZI9_9GAMM|nr:Translation initiation factor IF-3 [Candidatus Azoamicus ciliaticola]